MQVCEDKYKTVYLICRNILHTKPNISGNLSHDALHFISGLLIKDPRRRLGAGKVDAQTLKKHPFFKVSAFPHHMSHILQVCQL